MAKVEGSNPFIRFDGTPAGIGRTGGDGAMSGRLIGSRVEFTDQDGLLLGVVGLDENGHAAVLEGSGLDAESFFSWQAWVSEEWANANGAGHLPARDGTVLISPLDGEPYLRALAHFTRTGYLNGRLVEGES
jgi:hypothetical protein